MVHAGAAGVKTTNVRWAAGGGDVSRKRLTPWFPLLTMSGDAAPRRVSLTYCCPSRFLSHTVCCPSRFLSHTVFPHAFSRILLTLTLSLTYCLLSLTLSLTYCRPSRFLSHSPRLALISSSGGCLEFDFACVRSDTRRDSHSFLFGRHATPAARRVCRPARPCMR